MLDTELFALLEQTADAAYTVTEQGEIRSWNRSAERLFGYPASEVLGRHIEEVFDAFDALGTSRFWGEPPRRSAIRRKTITVFPTSTWTSALGLVSASG